MDVSDWFYIVFLLISILAGVFGKKKKKGEQVTTFEQQLREQFNLNPDSYYEADEPDYQSTRGTEEVFFKQSTTVQSPEKKVESNSPFSKFSGVFRDHIDTSRKKSTRDIIKREEIKTSSENRDKLRLNLKEMIIYDAIINRPKF